jgi:hypothetical protein
MWYYYLRMKNELNPIIKAVAEHYKFASKEIVKKIQLDVFQETLNIVKSMSDKVGDGRLELSYAETHYQNALDDACDAIKDEMAKVKGIEI